MMRFCFSLVMFLTLFAQLNNAIADEYSLSKAKELPKSTPKHLSAILETNGLIVSHKKEVKLRLWIRKDIPAKANFKPSYSVHYPFAMGELVGMIQIPKGKPFSDFRQQEIKAGLYTLRYGHIPEDGNHLGASEIADFLLAIPVAIDNSTKRMEKPKHLSEQSAKAVEAEHPAIFSLFNIGEDIKNETKIVYDEDHDHWVLISTVSVSSISDKKAKKKRIPFGLIVIGFAEE